MKQGYMVIIGAAVLLVPEIAFANTALLKEVIIAPSALQQVKGKPFTLTRGSRTWTVNAADARLWYKTKSGDDGSTTLQLRPGAIYDYLNQQVSPQVNVLGKNSRFKKVGDTVHLISGGSKGEIVDGVKTSVAIRNALVDGKTTTTVAMKEYRPLLFSAEDFAKIKFPDLLARGESNFAGSPKNRIHNITVGTSRFDGVVIMPDEEFSFNAYLGDVDAATGYAPELVIKENVTTPEYGGGICQISTTMFRAAMQAGLKITARRNHSYPVKYYGTPGYDATVYKPNPDVRFKNDTGKPALVKPMINGTKLAFELWGTSDGRQVTINGPFVTEKKPDGSLTAAVAQIVKKAGKTVREENFVSKYQNPDKFPKVLKENGER